GQALLAVASAAAVALADFVAPKLGHYVIRDALEAEALAAIVVGARAGLATAPRRRDARGAGRRARPFGLAIVAGEAAPECERLACGSVAREVADAVLAAVLRRGAIGGVVGVADRHRVAGLERSYCAEPVLFARRGVAAAEDRFPRTRAPEA